MSRQRMKVSILVVVLVLAAIAGALYFFGGGLMRAQIEKSAGTSIGREVGIHNISLAPFKGNIGFDQITVQNAEGYDLPYVMSIDKVSVDTRIGSLLSNVARVNSLKLEGVEVFIEQKALQNNLRDVLAGMPAAEDPEGQEHKKGKKINIEKTTIEKITVNLAIAKQGEEVRALQLQIDPIVIEDIGTEKEINSGAVAARIMAAIASGAIKQTSGELPTEVVQQIQSTAGNTLGKSKVILGEGGKIIKETGGRVFEGVRNLFESDNQED
ncbi:MAG: hypothetical protein ACOCUY_02470 [Verrucomicrobiota bacterium]